MLLCDIASLSRLSITIVSLTGLPTPQKLNQFAGSRFDGSDYTIVILAAREDEPWKSYGLRFGLPETETSPRKRTNDNSPAL